MWHLVLCGEGKENRVSSKNGDLCYTVAKYLLKLLPAIMWKAGRDEPVASGKAIRKRQNVRVENFATYNRLLLEKISLTINDHVYRQK